MTTFKITTNDGCDAQLWSDDTFTLHFGEGFEDQVESTPTDLAAAVSRESLEEIARTGSSSDRDKANAALDIACPLRDQTF